MGTIARSRMGHRCSHSLISVIAETISLRRQRRALAALDSRALEDIGVTKDMAQKEASKWFWDAPDHWLRPNK